MHTYVDIACLEERKDTRLHRAFFDAAAAVRARRA
jgi:hypothetical protein